MASVMRMTLSRSNVARSRTSWRISLRCSGVVSSRPSPTSRAHWATVSATARFSTSRESRAPKSSSLALQCSSRSVMNLR